MAFIALSGTHTLCIVTQSVKHVERVCRGQIRGRYLDVTHLNCPFVTAHAVRCAHALLYVFECGTTEQICHERPFDWY